MEQTSLRIASAIRSTTRSSLACAEPRLAMTSWRPVNISRAEVAALTGMDQRYQKAGPQSKRLHSVARNRRPNAASGPRKAFVNHSGGTALALLLIEGGPC